MRFLEGARYPDNPRKERWMAVTLPGDLGYNMRSGRRLKNAARHLNRTAV